MHTKQFAALVLLSPASEIELGIKLIFSSVWTCQISWVFTGDRATERIGNASIYTLQRQRFSRVRFSHWR